MTLICNPPSNPTFLPIHKKNNLPQYTVHLMLYYSTLVHKMNRALATVFIVQSIKPLNMNFTQTEKIMMNIYCNSMWLLLYESGVFPDLRWTRETQRTPELRIHCMITACKRKCWVRRTRTTENSRVSHFRREKSNKSQNNGLWRTENIPEAWEGFRSPRYATWLLCHRWRSRDRR